MCRQIDKLDMGDKPIHITGVTRYDTEMDGAMMDLHVEWKGNPHIVIGVGAGMVNLPVELLNLTFAGTPGWCTSVWRGGHCHSPFACVQRNCVSASCT